MKIPVRTAATANLQHWRAGQGERIKANRPPEVYSACEFMAKQLAPVRDPLVLTADELAVCVKRAICQERSKRHPGPPPTSPDVFWSQIESIGQSWTVKFKRGDWESVTKERKVA